MRPEGAVAPATGLKSTIQGAKSAVTTGCTSERRKTLAVAGLDTIPAPKDVVVGSCITRAPTGVASMTSDGKQDTAAAVASRNKITKALCLRDT